MPPAKPAVRKAKTRNYRDAARVTKNATGIAEQERLALKRRKQVDTIDVARSALADTESAGKEHIVTYLQTVRLCANLAPLTPTQIDLIPSGGDFLDALLDLSTNPLTFDPTLWHEELILCQASADTDNGLADSLLDAAQYYHRSISFDSEQDLKRDLEAFLKQYPHYYDYISGILHFSSKLAPGPRNIGYGGFTVATSPSGRSQDDAGVAVAMLFPTLASALNKTVTIYEWTSLRFTVANIISARADERTSLFEMVIVDAYGLVCGNIAPGGGVWRPLVPQEDRDWSYTPPAAVLAELSQLSSLAAADTAKLKVEKAEAEDKDMEAEMAKMEQGELAEQAEVGESDYGHEMEIDETEPAASTSSGTGKRKATSTLAGGKRQKKGTTKQNGGK